jgi:succinoglycan biosynthesis protein ExoA
LNPSIQILSLNDLPQIANIHLKAFPKSYLSKLGIDTTSRYYEWLLTGPHEAFAIGAFEERKLAGFCFGGIFRGAMSGFVKRNRLFLIKKVLLHPWLFFDREFQERIKSSLPALFSRKRQSSKTFLPVKSFGILAICVDPEYQNRGLGQLLMDESEQKARCHNFHEMDLTVHPENIQAVSFYKKLGWEKENDLEPWRGRMKKNLSVLPHPFVTVIMPIRNEGSYIDRSLKSVLEQDYPKERMEILVVDGLSADNTVERVQSYQKLNPRIKILMNEDKIVASGLNLGIRESRGEIIVRVDGHCEIQPDYVSQCVSLLETNKADAVGGPIETVGETFIAKGIAAAMSSWFGVGGSSFRTGIDREKEADTVPFPAYRRQLFEKVGLFDKELVRNQDDEHNYRIREFGGKVLLSPKIRSRYYSRNGFVSLWKQYFQYGYWKVRVMQKHPKQMKARQFVPFLFILSLLFLSVLSLALPQTRPLLLALTALYVFVSLLNAASTAIKTKAVYLPFIFAAAAVMHLSYGLGFFSGFLKFSLSPNKENAS